MSIETITRSVYQSESNKNIQYGKASFAVFLAGFASLAGWFLGYDQGVTGGVVVMSSFKNDFCVGVFGNESVCEQPIDALPADYRRFVLLFNLMYNAGCFLGGLFISTYVAETFGRRAIIFTSAVLFLVGTSIVIFPPGGSKKIMILVLFGRIIEGMGVGCASFSCPLYASEIAPTHLRGMLSGFMQMTIVVGLFTANVVNVFFQGHKWGWRLSNGVILISPIMVIIGIFFCPETPRWLYKRKGRQIAEDSLKRIRKIDNVTAELNAIADGIRDEGNELSIRDLLKSKKLLKRLAIGMSMHSLQQLTGINPVFTYGGIIFESVLGTGIISLLILSCVLMLSTFPGLFLFDRLGRRNLLLFCGLGMIIGHFVSATIFATSCTVIHHVMNETMVNQEIIECTKTSGILMLTFTAIFVGCFAISWGPVCWIYTAEIYPLHIRARALSFVTGSNWFTATVMAYMLELFAPLGIHGVFYLFGFLCCLAVVFVYVFCPETKGVLLEDIDDVFDNFQLKNSTAIKKTRKLFRRNIIRTYM